MKTDYKKNLKAFYNPSAKAISEVVVPKMNFLMIDGQGSPRECKAWSDAIECLYPVAYSLKFSIKKSTGFDYGVMPLEGLWWADDMNDFTAGNREKWRWTLMIMQPDVVTRETYEKALVDVNSKKRLACIDQLRFESFEEGRSAQIMHLGPFSEEGHNIMKIHHYIENVKGTFEGKLHKHHEIYLSDMRKVSPEKMKTILRQPFYHGV